jgi:hypothetical protein
LSGPGTFLKSTTDFIGAGFLIPARLALYQDVETFDYKGCDCAKARSGEHAQAEKRPAYSECTPNKEAEREERRHSEKVKGTKDLGSICVTEYSSRKSRNSFRRLP